MTIDQIIALAASLGGGLSAVAAVVVVFQNTIQLRSSLKPDLVLPVFSFRTEGEGPEIGRLWVEDGIPANQGAMARPRLVNIGREAAKNVTLTWTFPVEETVATLNSELEKLPDCAIRFEYFAGLVQVKAGGQFRSMVQWRGCREQHLDFVLPVSVDRPDTRILLPPAYSVLVGALIYCRLSKDEPQDIPSVPPLLLDLEYEDIGGNKYRHHFLVSMEIGVIGDKGASIGGRLKVQKPVVKKAAGGDKQR
jgi:hypothetical protein